MPPPLSYPGLKCVLEFLDPARRIHITARNATLQRIDNEIPYRMNTLGICAIEISQNDFVVHVPHHLSILFKNNVTRKDMLREVPEQRVRWEEEESAVMHKLYNNYLRANLLVNHLVFSSTDSHIPLNPNLTFTINKLGVYHCNYLRFLPNINPSSFPLEYLKIVRTGDSDVLLDHPIIHSAKILEIDSSTGLPDIHLLRNKNVFVEYHHLQTADVLRIIRHWMANGKEIGTKFLFTYFEPMFIRLVTSAVSREFHRVLERADNQINPEFSRFEIPLTATSKLLFYGMERVPVNRFINPVQLVLSVVPRAH
ncbi:hypothetical protein GCK72_008001 [Caenorhabditis remanei]|uniref:F-box associated domain-containing protein n=1 Tax=Caenorhabditis remanei TaxID=31234 RepID=A0A6A5HIQ0_CAERE|nr:hypothetical protein GCK72_008001 [Caenorhabditis remanei]KAF1768040.1 hypothetical protein GCK72_008001 [Caenorhabditis remanei]